MQIKPIELFFRDEYKVRFINCLRQHWKNGGDFTCIGSPKQKNIFLLLEGCSAKYTDKHGNVIHAHSGDMVYTPANSEYTVCFYNVDSKNSYTIGINFDLFDANGLPFIFSDTPVCFYKNETLRMLCKEIERLTFTPVQIPVKYNVVLYNIFSELGMTQTASEWNKSTFRLIEKGLEYIIANLGENVNVKDLAQKCNISEVYFRKLFKLHVGKAPVQYRNDMRMEKARQYLTYGENSITEIAETLGFSDCAYFIKQFRKETGKTPLAYRKAHKL